MNILNNSPHSGYELLSFSHNHGSVENVCIWKVTIRLEIHPFFTEPMIMGETDSYG